MISEKKKSKSIEFLIGSLRNGGAERVMSHLTQNISNKNEKYLYIYDIDEIDYPYKGKLIICNQNKSKTSINKYFREIYYLIYSKYISVKYNIDISISFLPYPNLVNLLTFSRSKKIVSVRIYSSIIKGFKRKIKNLIIRLLYNYADAIVAVSKGVKYDLIHNFGIQKEKIHVINNPYDIEQIMTLRKEDIEEQYKFIFKNPVIINVGRLTYQKGHIHLIRSFHEAKKRIKNLKLVILGRGELKGKLKKLIFDLKLSNDVFLLGFQKNPFKFIYRSKIYVCSSLFEGFGNALVEAMACKISIISTDCNSSPREILSPKSNIFKKSKNLEICEYGILIPVCDRKIRLSSQILYDKEKIMSDSIVKLIEDEELRNKLAILAEERAKDFHIQKIIKIWEKFLHNF